MTLTDLPTLWREQAELLDRCGCTEAAATTRTRAEELEEALAAQAQQLLTLQEAAEVSGYSARRLRELVSEGALPNHGRKGSPRFKRGELPRKPGSSGPDTFDAEAEALRLMGS